MKSVMRVWLVLLVFVCGLGSPPANAQQSVAAASVSGTVIDPTGAVVVGATVRLHNLETNSVVETTTDDHGRYRFTYVSVGRYQLSAAATGFVPAVTNLTLSIGQALDVPMKLVAGSLSESVSVNAESPIIDAARTPIADVIRPQEIDTLPLNGRNYLDLALLVPNVTRTNTRSAERFAETSVVPGTGITVAGQRNIGNSFIVDGLSANDDAADLAGTYFGEEIIREFQVITSGGTAEFGRASAGTINIVTQSGANERRGRAYGFFRNNALDARNALASTKDPLNQRQYGLSLGGPLVRDRAFWFANFERTEQDKTGYVTISPANVSAVNASLDVFGYRGPRIATGGFLTGFDTTNGLGRIDHRATTDTRLSVRYSVYDVSSGNARGAGGLNDVSRGTRLDDTDQTGAVSVLSSISSSVINEARAQFTRSRLAAAVNDAVGPAVTVSGVAAFGTATASPTSRDLDLFEAADTLTVQHGAHLIKAGADFLYQQAFALPLSFRKIPISACSCRTSGGHCRRLR